uniref:integral membrane protein 2B-like isoform X1 n=1 Tax=Myxine glutinosa TaxID=7769 RepID=UPI00358E7EFE
MVKLALGVPLGQKVLKVEAEQPVLGADVDEKRTGLITQDVEAMTVPSRRRSKSWGVCLVLGLALMLAGLVVVGTYLYRYYITHVRDDHLTGSLPLESRLFHCGLRFTDGQHGGLPVNQDLQHTGPTMPLISIEEDVEIDIERNVEIIRVPVPGFSESDPAEIVHDFHRLLTAYYDISLKKCYVIPLNTSIIMPPQSLFELLLNIKLGTYLPQTYLVHEDLVVTEQVQDVDDLGFFIFRMCRGHPTFRLQRRHREPGLFVKREAEECRIIVSFANKFALKTQICERSG